MKLLAQTVLTKRAKHGIHCDYCRKGLSAGDRMFLHPEDGGVFCSVQHAERMAMSRSLTHE